MPRGPRGETPEGVYHVYARGNGRMRIFRDDIDRRVYLSLLGKVSERQGWRWLSYCLMENHLHLLLETPSANLGAGMHRAHGRYAQWFNARHRNVGHVFQGRYGSTRIESNEQQWAVVGYIARNPVAAGLCPRAEDWTWSSHAEVLGRRWGSRVDRARLLELFSAFGGDGLRRYMDCVGGGAS